VRGTCLATFAAHEWESPRLFTVEPAAGAGAL